MNFYDLPFTVDVDIHVSKCLGTAVEVLTLTSNTLKFNLVCKIHFFPHSLHFDVWVEPKYAANTVL